MENWEKMFSGVQAIAQSAKDTSEGLNQTIALARSDVRIFNKPDYWDRVEKHAAKLPWDMVEKWVRDGMERLTPSMGWNFLIVDLGDCPEIFYLNEIECERKFDEQKFRDLILSWRVVDWAHFAECFETKDKDDLDILFARKENVLADHDVRELNDELLTWNQNSGNDFNGDNGYLLWLAVGSLSLIEPFRDVHYCKRILAGRDRLYLLSGFEEIFLYLATVTPVGLRFEIERPAN